MKGKYSTYVNGVRTKITPAFAASHGIIQASKAPRPVPAEAARCCVPINYLSGMRAASEGKRLIPWKGRQLGQGQGQGHQQGTGRPFDSNRELAMEMFPLLLFCFAAWVSALRESEETL